ncbi:MAG: hypothetical protein MZU95_16530 [Desulfomicrobium escambiense]|nr:hypothetical protein [Desulfomicrobium escambiense]
MKTVLCPAILLLELCYALLCKTLLLIHMLTVLRHAPLMLSDKLLLTFLRETLRSAVVFAEFVFAEQTVLVELVFGSVYFCPVLFGILWWLVFVLLFPGVLRFGQHAHSP